MRILKSLRPVLLAWWLVTQQMFIWAVLVYLLIVRPLSGDRYFLPFLALYAFVITPIASIFLWLGAKRRLEKRAASGS